MKKEWFGAWFDSPYYHILYQHRDDSEAKHLIDNLVSYLQLRSECKILDVACGRGRHALYLNKKGFDVTGIDLSPQSIDFAKKKENLTLHYFTHDMRQVFQENEFDLVLNLFTSFGYFETEEDNFLAAEALGKNIQVGGKLVLDFFNAEWVRKTLIPYEEKINKGIVFKITKYIEAGFIVKAINFEAQNQIYHFEEKVRLIKLEDFTQYFHKTGLKIEAVFGNYKLASFNAETSERLILVMGK